MTHAASSKDRWIATGAVLAVGSPTWLALAAVGAVVFRADLWTQAAQVVCAGLIGVATLSQLWAGFWCVDKAFEDR